MLTDDISIEELSAIRYKEGREDGREEIARKMKSKELPVEEIAEYTGLSVDAVKIL